MAHPHPDRQSAAFNASAASAFLAGWRSRLAWAAGLSGLLWLLVLWARV